MDDLVKRLREAHSKRDGFLAVHAAPAAADRIEADAKRIAEVFQMYVDANEARIDAEARVKALEDALRRICATSSAMSADYIYGGGESGHERTARLARAALEGEKT